MRGVTMLGYVPVVKEAGVAPQPSLLRECSLSDPSDSQSISPTSSTSQSSESELSRAFKQSSLQDEDVPEESESVPLAPPPSPIQAPTPPPPPPPLPQPAWGVQKVVDTTPTDKMQMTSLCKMRGGSVDRTNYEHVRCVQVLSMSPTRGDGIAYLHTYRQRKETE